MLDKTNTSKEKKSQTRGGNQSALDTYVSVKEYNLLIKKRFWKQEFENSLYFTIFAYQWSMCRDRDVYCVYTYVCIYLFGVCVCEVKAYHTKRS